MKTATLPSLRVDPGLRAAAESVLKEGESLSAFVENSVKAQVNYRKTQAEFIARGLRRKRKRNERAFILMPMRSMPNCALCFRSRRLSWLGELQAAL